MQLHSLRVKVTLYSLLLVMAMCAFFIVVDYRSLQSLLEKNRNSRYLSYQQQIEALLSDSREDLSQLTDLFVLWRGGRAPGSGILQRLIDQQWAYLEESWGLESLKLYSLDGRPPMVWGEPTRRLTESQIEELRLGGPPLERVHCGQTCVQSLAMLVTAGDRSEEYLLQVDRSLDNELLAFRQLTESDIGILSAPGAQDQTTALRHLRHWKRSVIAMTSQDALMPLLRSVSAAEVGLPELRYSHSHTFGARSFDVKTFPLSPVDPLGAQFVIVDDVTDQVRHIKDSIALLMVVSVVGALVFVSALIAILWRPIVRLRRLAEALPLLSGGEFDSARDLIQPIQKPRSRYDEIDVLDSTGLTVCDQLELMKEIVAHNTAELERIAMHDTLTGLANRLCLLEELERYLHAEAIKGTSTGYVFFIDLDDFKQVNDSHGHQCGDELLRVVARRLVSVMRQEDMVARLGGDEFCVFVRSAEGEGAHRILAEKLLGTAAEPVKVGGEVLRITLSIGIVAIPQHGLTIETIMQKADTAMYHAKYRGKNNYQFYSEALPGIEDLSTTYLQRRLPEAVSASGNDG